MLLHDAPMVFVAGVRCSLGRHTVAVADLYDAHVAAGAVAAETVCSPLSTPSGLVSPR